MWLNCQTRVRVNTYSSVFLPPFAPTLMLPLCRCHVAASLIKFHISKVPSSVRRDKDDRYIHLLLSLRRPVMDVCIRHIKGEKKNHLWLHSGADSVLCQPSCPFLFSLQYFLSFILLLWFFNPDWCQLRNKLGVCVSVRLLLFLWEPAWLLDV